MVTGPVEYLVVTFPDGALNDDMSPELAALVDEGLISILDIVFLTKDVDGGITTFEYDQLDELAGFAELDGEIGGLIGPEDLDFIGEGLDPGAAAAVLVIEDRWAAPLADAVGRAGGLLSEGVRIPSDIVEDALELAAAV